MKDLAFKIVLIGIISLSNLVMAQEMDIPRVSPKASISQIIGVNKVSITYGRPAVRGRKIIGNLVPLNKVWRSGANEATTITFEKEVRFEGKDVPKGTYSLFMIPSKNKWIVILNKIAHQWGAYNYDSYQDLLRVEVRLLKIPFTERCTYLFQEVTKSNATLTLNWEYISVPIHISTDTKKQTLGEIDKELGNSFKNWYNFSAAAQYHFYELNELDKAIEYLDIAIALKAPNPSPWMLKSQILAQQKKYSEAINYAKEAIVICKEKNFEFEIHENEEHILKWEKLIKTN